MVLNHKNPKLARLFSDWNKGHFDTIYEQQ